MKDTSKITSKELAISFKKLKEVKVILKTEKEGKVVSAKLNKLGVKLYAPALPGIVRK